MKSIRHLILLVLACVSVSAQATPRDQATEEANRKLVIEFYDRFFNRHEVKEAAAVVTEDYKQHNPDVPDGRAPLVDYFVGYFKDHPKAHARIVRTASEGDLVYMHVHWTSGPKDRGQAILDLFRVRNGKIVEHWDVIQDVPEKSANQNTMF